MYYINKDSDHEYSVSLEDQGNTVLTGDWDPSSYMDAAFNALLALNAESSEETPDVELTGFTLKNNVSISA